MRFFPLQQGFFICSMLIAPFAMGQCPDAQLRPEWAGSVYVDLNVCEGDSVDPLVILWRENTLEDVARTGSAVSLLAKIRPDCAGNVGHLSLLVFDTHNRSIALLRDFSVNKQIMDCQGNEAGVLAWDEGNPLTAPSVLYSRSIDVGEGVSAYYPDLWGRTEDHHYYDQHDHFKLAFRVMNYTNKCVAKRWHVLQNGSSRVDAFAPVLVLALSVANYSKRCSSVGYVGSVDGLKAQVDSADFDDSLRSRSIFIAGTVVASFLLFNGFVGLVHSLDHRRFNKGDAVSASILFLSIGGALAMGYSMGPVYVNALKPSLSPSKSAPSSCGCVLGPFTSWETADVTRCPSSMRTHCQSSGTGHTWVNSNGAYVFGLVIFTLGIFSSTIVLTTRHCTPS